MNPSVEDRSDQSYVFIWRAKPETKAAESHGLGWKKTLESLPFEDTSVDQLKEMLQKLTFSCPDPSSYEFSVMKQTVTYTFESIDFFKTEEIQE